MHRLRTTGVPSAVGSREEGAGDGHVVGAAGLAGVDESGGGPGAWHVVGMAGGSPGPGEGTTPGKVESYRAHSLQKEWRGIMRT